MNIVQKSIARIKRWSAKRDIFDRYGDELVAEGIWALAVSEMTCGDVDMGNGQERPTSKERWIRLMGHRRYRVMWLARYGHVMSREEMLEYRSDMIRLREVVASDG